MNTFYMWFKNNRKLFGYFTGGAVLSTCVLEMLSGNILMGVFWLLLGSLIIFDTWEFK